MVVCAEFQFAADTLQFVQLRLFQVVALRRENSRRIHHGGVEKVLEQVVAQIVVGLDIAP